MGILRYFLYDTLSSVSATEYSHKFTAAREREIFENILC